MFPRGRGTNSHNSRLILVTGGARSGKSRFALSLAESHSPASRLFIATAVATDSEMRSRIARHRKERDGSWRTLEEPVDLPGKLSSRFLHPGSLILLDCLPTFVTNLLLAKQSHSQIEKRVQALVAALRGPGLTSILVTNEVGCGLVPETPLGRRFRDLLGKVNQQTALLADQVYLLVAGIPMRVK
jgi:adenosylcobinamide kinase/adenosylcobinamide-phosphate guanylyltransferase